MKRKRRGHKLTYDFCKEIALKYDTKIGLQKGDGSVYGKIRTSKWFELFSHMKELQKSPGYWTYERCKEVALNYTTKISLQKGNGTVYNVIRNNKWSDDLFSHMKELLKPNGYWTIERCRQEALKYSRRVDFQKGSCDAQSAAQKKGWMDEICQHMGKPHTEKQYTKEEILESSKKYTNQRDWINNEPSIFRCASGYNKKGSSDEDKKFWLSCIEHMEYLFKPNGYWTYERCKEVALKFKTIKDFREDVEHRSVYPIILKNEWLDLLGHLEQTIKPKGYWTYETCKEAALKYKTRTELSLSEDCTAYGIITKNGWFELLFHMKRQMTQKERVIYVYEFKKSKVAYIGLTCQIERRHNAHMGKETRYGKIVSPVYKFMNETGETPKFKLLTKKPIKEENAPSSEDYYIKKYRTNGWKLLNSARAGSLGSKYIWTKDKVESIAKNLTKHSELRSEMKNSIYSYVKNNEWWEDVTSHLEKDVRTNWTDQEALEIGYRYDSISLLCKEFNGVAKYIRRNSKLRKELDLHWESCKEENRLKNVPTKEECIEVAMRYEKRGDFRKNDGGIFKTCEKNGWLDEVCSHMTRLYWTYERCKEEVLKYRYRHELQEKSKGCHNSIYTNKWFDLLSHMPERKVRNDGKYMGKYTKDMIVELSKGCKYVSEFQDKYSGAYKAAKKLNLLKELFDKKK